MGILSIKEALSSNKPFKVRTADGKVVPVPHREFAMLSPTGRVLYVANENEGLEWLDVDLITALEFENSPLPPKR